MMRFYKFVVIWGGLALPLGTFAGAAAWGRQQLSATPILRMGRYDTSAEIVVSGTIGAIQGPKNSTLPRGTYVTLLASPLTFNVHMGLLSAASIPFRAGDHVSVTGALTSINGTQILLARQVQSDSQNLIVRTPKGFVVRAHPMTQVQARP